MTRENEPAAEQARENEAERERDEPADRRLEGEPAAEQARDEER